MAEQPEAPKPDLETDGYDRPSSEAQVIAPTLIGEWDGYAAPHPTTALTIAPPVEAKPLPSKSNPAEWMFDRLIRLIEDFEKGLSDQEEIGGRLTGSPGEGTFHIDDIGFWGPDLIMFYGKNRDGRPIRLIQHYQQLSVLLTSMPKETKQPARRIGFAIQQRIEAEEKAVEEAEEKAAEEKAEADAAAAETEAQPS